MHMSMHIYFSETHVYHIHWDPVSLKKIEAVLLLVSVSLSCKQFSGMNAEKKQTIYLITIHPPKLMEVPTVRLL